MEQMDDQEHKDKIQAALTECVKETRTMAPNDFRLLKNGTSLSRCFTCVGRSKLHYINYEMSNFT